MAVDQFCGIPIPTDDPDLATKLRRVACITATYSALFQPPLPRLSLLSAGSDPLVHGSVLSAARSPSLHSSR